MEAFINYTWLDKLLQEDIQSCGFLCGKHLNHYTEFLTLITIRVPNPNPNSNHCTECLTITINNNNNNNNNKLSMLWHKILFDSIRENNTLILSSVIQKLKTTQFKIFNLVWKF